MSEQKAFVETPEFTAAVTAAVESKVTEILGSLKEGGALGGGDRKFAENLAMAFATLSEQGTGRKYVAPDVLRARTEAREKMFALLVQARRDKKMPAYRVVAKTLLDDQIVEPMWVDSTHIAQPTEIDWPGVPNDAMVPLNEVAKEIFAAYMDSIGSKPKSVSASGAEFEAPDPMDDGYGVTAKGLVVRGGAIPRQNRPEAVAAGHAEQGLNVHHRGGPGTIKEVRVLGKTAAPARQTV